MTGDERRRRWAPHQRFRRSWASAGDGASDQQSASAPWGWGDAGGVSSGSSMEKGGQRETGYKAKRGEGKGEERSEGGGAREQELMAEEQRESGGKRRAWKIRRERRAALGKLGVE